MMNHNTTFCILESPDFERRLSLVCRHGLSRSFVPLQSQIVARWTTSCWRKKYEKKPENLSIRARRPPPLPLPHTPAPNPERKRRSNANAPGRCSTSSFCRRSGAVCRTGVVVERPRTWCCKAAEDYHYRMRTALQIYLYLT